MGGAMLPEPATVVDARRERAALDELHAEILLPAVLADFVERHDVRMIQASGGLGFGVKASHLRIAGQQSGANHLHGDDAVEADLAGAIDDAHAAGSKFLQQFVVAEVAEAAELAAVCG